MLIERGADVSWDIQDKGGQTPIHVVPMEIGLILAFFISSFRTYFGTL